MRLNTDNTTNAAIGVMVAIELMEKATGHQLSADAKGTITEVLLGIGLWFTGKPSPTTNRILSHLGINNDLASGNPGFNSASDRAPDVGSSSNQHRDNRDLGLEPPPPPIDPAVRAAEYWRDRPAYPPVVGSPAIDGTQIPAVQYSAWSQSGEEGKTEGFARLEVD